MVETKVCTKCGAEKPVSEFYRDKHNRDGFRNRCKPCVYVPKKPLRQREQLPEGKKRCSTCNEIKEVMFFSKNKLNLDGYGYQCKACRSKYRKSKKGKKSISKYNKKNFKT